VEVGCLAGVWTAMDDSTILACRQAGAAGDGKCKTGWGPSPGAGAGPVGAAQGHGNEHTPLPQVATQHTDLVLRTKGATQ